MREFRDLHGSALISLLSGILFLVVLVISINFFLPRSTSIGGNGGSDNDSVGITDPIDQANTVATQADLKSIQTSLEVYFAENGQYPSSLSELSSQGYLQTGVDVSSFNYQTCNASRTSIVVSKGDQGFTSNYGDIQNFQGTVPSC